MKKLIYRNEFKPKIELNKNDLDIEEITLLSVEEAEKLPNYILAIDRWWWLRSPSYNQNRAVYVVNDGDIFVSGWPVNSGSRSVRPALRISNLKSYDLKFYDIIKFLNNLWYVISDDMLLSVKAVGHTAFNNDALKPNSNKFEGSDIQKWLQNWLSKKLSVEESMKVNKLNSIESTRSHQNVARLTEKFDEYSFTTYGDILSGDIGNMSEEQLDQELKFFKRKAKALGLRRPEDLVIYIDEEDEFAPDWEYREEKVVDKNSKLYDADGIKVIYEIINGRSFLYFNSKENAKEYFSKFEQ